MLFDSPSQSYLFDATTEKKKSMQEFVIPADISGTIVPPLHAITLAVDSNWGSEYSCLYRFRVHGKPGKPKSVGSIPDNLSFTI